MASTNPKELQNGQLLTTTNGAAVSVKAYEEEFVAWMNVSAINGATTLDVDIEMSADGTNWVNVASFAQLVGVTGTEAINITVNMLSQVRMVATLAGATEDATMVINLYCSKKV